MSLATNSRGLTAKQEAFVRFYIELGNASAAYRRAYDTNPNCKPNTVEKRACELLKKGKVAGRIEEARANAAAHSQKKLNITVEYLTEKLEAALNKAMDETKGASAAVSAAMGLGKLHGLIVDRKEVTHKTGVEDLDDHELADIARGGSDRAAQAAPGSTLAH